MASFARSGRRVLCSAAFLGLVSAAGCNNTTSNNVVVRNDAGADAGVATDAAATTDSGADAGAVDAGSDASAADAGTDGGANTGTGATGRSPDGGQG